jgi:hypothetical protein
MRAGVVVGAVFVIAIVAADLGAGPALARYAADDPAGPGLPCAPTEPCPPQQNPALNPPSAGGPFPYNPYNDPTNPMSPMWIAQNTGDKHRT